MTKISLSERERAVLEILADEDLEEGSAFYFRGIVSRLPKAGKLEEAQVRKACRSLARKGLAEYVRGLFDDDGQVAGSGYAATAAGRDLMAGLRAPQNLDL